MEEPPKAGPENLALLMGGAVKNAEYLETALERGDYKYVRKIGFPERPGSPQVEVPSEVLLELCREVGRANARVDALEDTIEGMAFSRDPRDD